MDDLHLRIRVHHDTLPDPPSSLARSKSAPRERQAAPAQRHSAPHQSALQQLQLPGRNQRRHVSLGESWEGEGEAPARLPDEVAVVDEVPVCYQGPGLSVRVRCYCLGEEFDRGLLQTLIMKRSSSGSVRAYPEVLCSAYRTAYTTGDGPAGTAPGDIFYFDWGAVVFWGLDKGAERHILREIAEPCLVGATLPAARQEREAVRVLYTPSPRTFIANDTLAIHFRYAEDINVKLALSFALSQSTKLSVYEEELRRMGRSMAYLPADLAESGDVPLSDRGIMRAVGQLYQQMQAVSLLGAALDVPAAMASAPSNIRTLYKAVYDYLDVADRLALLNDRFGVMREMLELCRTLGMQARFALLETIILWLVGVCVLLAFFQLIGFIGWRPAWRE